MKSEESVVGRLVISFPRVYSALVSDSMEGARLGRIGRMIIRDQLGCVPELHGQDPRGLLVGTGIPGPADEIQ